MTPTQWARARELFDLAAAMPEQERAAWVAANTPDQEVAVQVLAQLQALVSDPFEVCVPDAGIDFASLPGEQPGDRIGSYVIGERIGEGGMGIVYRAEQVEPVRRHVALKVIAPGMHSRRVLTRFAAERQALARMKHPGIAELYDAGTTSDGRPWFAMELVDGEPITMWCDRARLSTRDRVQLFRRVCDAVQHAHHQGIMHRDLKPANLLVTEVDGRPQPKIIDFGIARALHGSLTDESTLTLVSEVVGTPVYMSPEQLRPGMAVDTRTDVYSLGVLLYELLTGEAPFGADRASGTHAHGRTPDTPSTRVRQTGVAERLSARQVTNVWQLSGVLRGDLDCICLCALEHDRERRYATAAELGSDLGRYLANEPVAAGPVGALYRLRKAVRRHRVAVAAVGLVAVSLVVGAVVAAGYAIEAGKQAVLARAGSAAAASRLQELYESAYTSDVTMGLLGSPSTGEIGPSIGLDILDDARPGFRAASHRLRDAAIRSREEAIKSWRELARLAGRVDASDSPVVRNAASRMRGRLAYFLHEYGFPEEAEPILARSFLAEQGRPVLDVARALAHVLWMEALLDLGHHEQVHTMANDALEQMLVGSYLPDNHVVVAIYRSCRGAALVGLGRQEDAEVDLAAATAVLERVSLGSKYHRDALFHMVQLRTTYGTKAECETARQKLAYAMQFGGVYAVDRECRAVLGTEYSTLWGLFLQLRSAADEEGAEIEDHLRNLIVAVARSGVAQTDYRLALGVALILPIDAIGNVHGWKEQHALDAAQLACDLLRPKHSGDRAVTYDCARMRMGIVRTRRGEFAVAKPMLEDMLLQVDIHRVGGIFVHWMAQRMLGNCELHTGHQVRGVRRLLASIHGLQAHHSNAQRGLLALMSYWQSEAKLPEGVDVLLRDGVLDNEVFRRWVFDFLVADGHRELAEQKLRPH